MFVPIIELIFTRGVLKMALLMSKFNILDWAADMCLGEPLVGDMNSEVLLSS